MAMQPVESEVLAVPATEEEGPPDQLRDALELVAGGLVLLAAAIVLGGLIQAVSYTQVGETEPDLPLSFILQLAAGGARWETVVALAAGLGLVLVSARSGVGRIGRVVLNAVVVLGGVLAVMAAYLTEELVRTFRGARSSSSSIGGLAPDSQRFLQQVGLVVYLVPLGGVAALCAYVAWRVTGSLVTDDDPVEPAGAADA